MCDPGRVNVLDVHSKERDAAAKATTQSLEVDE